MAALGAAMLAAGAAGYAWSRTASLLLVLLSAYWLYTDVHPEGPLLWKVSDGNGLVLADLWGVLGLVVGALLLVRGPRRRPRRH